MHQPILFNNPPKQNRQKPANAISEQQKHRATRQHKRTNRETNQHHKANKNNTNLSPQPARTT